jgi:hypothetical protein
VLSSCPVKAPHTLGWLRSGRFLRLLAPLAGVALVAGVLYNATSVDRVPPTFRIKLSAPASGGNLALPLTSITVIFSEQVKRDTAEQAFSVEPPVKGSFHWQGTTMTFTPSETLPLSATFTIHMAGTVQDLAGNAAGNAGDMSFTTVGSPRVVSIVPGLRAVAVPVDGPITITFDRDMDPQEVLDGLRIEPAVHYQASWNGPVLTIQPTEPLAYSTVYYVKIGDPAKATDGTRLSAFISTFTTVEMGLSADLVVPAANVVGISIHTQVAVFFDGPVDPTSIANSISLKPAVSGSVAVTTPPIDRQPAASGAASATPSPTPAQAGNRVLVFTPNQPLAAQTTYTVTMSASVRSTDSKAASPKSWTFTTGEPSASALNQIAFVSDRSGIENVWMMNPDGSNQHQVTAELMPVASFDVSGDGTAIAYEAGGVVKRMSIGGDNVQTVTASGAFEYGPTFTPDGTGLVVARRDAHGVDQGYWRVPLVSGSDEKRLTPDGAPLAGIEPETALSGQAGASRWAPRAAFSADGSKMLVVRGIDDDLELVDMTGQIPPLKLPLVANTRPIWDARDGAFYIVASAEHSPGPSCWRVTSTGETTQAWSAVGDMAAAVDGGLAYVLRAADGSLRVAYVASPSSLYTVLTSDPTWSEASPSFSPDGSALVFERFGTLNPTISGGIWAVERDGTGLVNLSTDGAFPRWLP